MMKLLVVNVLCCALFVGIAWAQPATSPAVSQPKIQVNFLNTCRPAAADVEKMSKALARVRDKPLFSADFEISRGHTTLNEAEARAAGAAVGGGSTTPSNWVRIRKEFPEKAVLADVQYSLSLEGASVSEVLALHMRDNKEVLQILISVSVTGSPAEVVKTATPPDRIRIERFGKSSIVLGRCRDIDQSAYEPLFEAASGILQKYREAMAVKRVVPTELSQLPGFKESKAVHVNH